MMWPIQDTCLSGLLAACSATPPPLYDGLGSSGHIVATDSELAQQYFDQGLALCWGCNHEAAFVSLRKGLEAEDALPYAEPPGWMQPIRHSLNALLLEDGRVAEAEAVDRADLARHADNEWSLNVLAECLRITGRDTEARAVAASLHRVGEHADVEITASCFCRTIDED